MSFPASEAQADTLKNRARVQESKDGRTHVCMSIPPLDAWIAIKIHLRRELGEKEWELWIRHARLMRVMGAANYRPHLMIALPRNGRCIFGAMRFQNRLRSEARKLRFGLNLAVAFDEEERRLALELAATFDPEDKRRLELEEKWGNESNFSYIEGPCSELWQ